MGKTLKENITIPQNLKNDFWKKPTLQGRTRSIYLAS